MAEIRTTLTKAEEKRRSSWSSTSRFAISDKWDSVCITNQIGCKEIGFDGGKCVKGRKRFVLVDALGLLLAVIVVGANTTEESGAQLLLNVSSGL